MHKVEAALAANKRRFIGGFGTRDARYYWTRSRYMPHQGAQEIARRLRQASLSGRKGLLRDYRRDLIERVKLSCGKTYGEFDASFAESVTHTAQENLDRAVEMLSNAGITTEMISSDTITIIPKFPIAAEPMISNKPITIGCDFDSGNPVGKRVTWTSNGVQKVGEITHVVPAGSTPAEVGAKVKDAGTARDHESFVISAVTIGEGKAAKTGSYWPRVSLLNIE